MASLSHDYDAMLLASHAYFKRPLSLSFCYDVAMTDQYHSNRYKTLIRSVENINSIQWILIITPDSVKVLFYV